MESPTAPLNLTLSDLERSNSRSPRFWRLISRKGAQLSPMLLLHINRKPYMGSPMALLHLTLSDLERSRSRRFLVKVTHTSKPYISPRFWRIISHTGAELGLMLLLNIDRKPYIGSPMALPHLTLSDLERSESRSFRFWWVEEDLHGIHICRQ